MAKYKNKDIFYVIRSLTDLNQYNVGDYIKTEWGRVYKIEDSQIYANIEDCPQLSLLSYE
jgi:Tfp pilus assembly protein PilP